jgi:hypothetical protein
MAEINETFFVNKCSSMPFVELSKYIDECFAYLESPQNHLNYVKKFPVLKETYDVLIEHLKSKLNKTNELERLKSYADSYKLPNLFKSENLNNLINEERRKNEDFNLSVLKCLLSDVPTASIFVNSNEPYYKIIEYLSALSEKNESISQIFSEYKFQDFHKLFANLFTYPNYESYLKEVIESEMPQIFKYFHFRIKVSVESAIKDDYYFLGYYKKDFLMARNRLINDWNTRNRLINDWNKYWNKEDSKGTLQISLKHKLIAKVCGEESLTTLVNRSRKLQDTFIRNLADDSDIKKLFKYCSNLDEEWRILNEQNKIDTHIIKKLTDYYQEEHKEYCLNFKSVFEQLKENTCNHLKSALEKALLIEGVDLDFNSSKEVLQNLENIKNQIFADSSQIMVIKEIFWELLPKGEWETEGFLKIFKGYGWSEEDFDGSRLTKIKNTLDPCFIAKGKFQGHQGYVVFGFNWTEKVVLECPKYGNAIYIINDRWQEITKLSKWEARQLPEVTVIRHSDTWFKRLKENLESKY